MSFIKFSEKDIKLLKQLLMIGAQFVKHSSSVWKNYHDISTRKFLSSSAFYLYDFILALKAGQERVSSAVEEEAQELVSRMEEFVGPRNAPPKTIHPRKSAQLPLGPHYTVGLSLRKWQKEALQTWIANDRRGVVKAVTGSGKTVVGIAAISDFLLSSPTGRVVVLAPSLALVEQWERELHKYLPSLEKHIGVRGGDRKAGFAVDNNIILVMTLQSADKNMEFEKDVIKDAPMMLVVDECHNIGSPKHAEILGDVAWDSCLGLSAYPYRDYDYGFEAVIEPGIGPVICEYPYESAVRDGVISPLEVVFIRLFLTDPERAMYDTLSERIQEQRKIVTNYFPILSISDNLPRDLTIIIKRAAMNIPTCQQIRSAFLQVNQTILSNFGESLTEYQTTTPTSVSDPTAEEEKAILRLYQLWIERSTLLHKIQSRAQCTLALASRIPTKRQTLVFHQFIPEVDSLTQQLRSKTDHRVATLHSGIDNREQAAVLEQFRNRQVSILVSCRSIDEGLDVPDADVAILTAVSRSERQIIQRTGRILRPSKEKALLFVLYAPGTVEDQLKSKTDDIFGATFHTHEISFPEELDKVAPLFKSGGSEP
jgi:superfamily II DNA or RNA helicase